METLSKKGVLFLTSGFHQHYVFQNLAHLIDDGQGESREKELKIILSDGEIYISGVLQIKKLNDFDTCEKLREFDVVRVLATYEGGTKPIHKGIYGLPPISLKDYMESRLLKSSNYIELSSERHVNFEEEKIQTDYVCTEKIINHEEVQNEKEEINQELLENESTLKNDKHQLSFELSNEENEYDLLNDINEMESKKRNEMTYNNERMVDIPQKKHKLNEDEHEEGEILLKEHQNQNKNEQLKPEKNEFSNPKNYELQEQKKITETQPISFKKQKEIEIIDLDLDSEPTQKESTPFLNHSNRRQYRSSHLKFIQSIFESDEKETQKISASNNGLIEHNDSITVPRSQTLNQETLITPSKPDNLQNTFNQEIMGSTTERKKLCEEYNLLIENLYESNSSFKIICRVNNLYEWKSKNDTPCMALDLMDSIGDEIKAIVYMNHMTKECKECGQMIEVGKVYCFQNGECKRDFIDKEVLELVFNLRTKSCWSKEISCGGRNKIIPAQKIKIQAFFENKVLSISELMKHIESGKNTLTNVYGILESFKYSEFEKKYNNENNTTEKDEDEKSDPEVEIIEVENVVSKEKKSTKKTKTKVVNKEGPTNIYLNGFLADPIERKKIAFACVISKPINGAEALTAENFLTKNGIKKGSLIILHNVKVQSTNNNTVHKLEKTKRTYLQIISDRYLKWQYNSIEFASETILINEIDQNTSLYPTLKQMLSFTQKEVDSIMENPRVINYSKQPFNERSISELNELIENSMMPEENCYSEIKGVKIHSIEQKPSVDICFYCKKKAKSPEQKSNSNSQAIKHCQRCKMIVKTITMHIFNIVFADHTASFLVEVIKDEYLETLLGIKIQEYLTMSEYEQQVYLDSIKYTEFNMKLRSEKKIDSVIHKINSIEKMPVAARIQEIKEEKKGLPRHYTRLDTSW